jgi:chemotaxis protein MotA
MTEKAEITAGVRGARVDAATVLGLGAALVFVAAGILYSGSPAAFFDLPSVFIVVGGTAAATVVCFNFPDLRLTISALSDTVVTRTRDPRDVAYTMLELADFGRRNGVLRLQGAPMKRFASEPVLHKGLGLVIDGMSDTEIETMLRDDILSNEDGVQRATQVIRKAAEIAPAMGLIGTLIGLVQMLGNLGDPKVIGPAMAVALLTTFYGAVLANLVLNPLAAKLERNNTDERLIQQLQLVGLMALARKDNVRRLELILNSFLPPGQKVQYVDSGPAP